MHVFVAENDAALTTQIAKDLRAWGYETDTAENGDMALQFILDNHDAYGLLIIDSMLPIVSGEEICKKIRDEHIQTPLLMLIGEIDLTAESTVRTCGADDYLVKPFSSDELRLRVSSLALRSTRFAPSVIELGGLTLGVRERTIEKADRVTHLTPTETAILEYFMLRPQKILGRQELFIAVWGKDSLQESNLVDVHIKNVRKKIQNLNGEEMTLRIETVRGAGYRLVV